MGGIHSSNTGSIADIVPPDANAAVSGQFAYAEALLFAGDRTPESVRHAEQTLVSLEKDFAHAPSAFLLGTLYQKAPDGITRNLARAVDYYEKAAASSFSEAYGRLANILREDHADVGVPRNLPRAVQLYQLAIAAGDTIALFNLALLLQHGDEAGGVQKDARQAEALYRRAIAAGHTDALNNLANLLRAGDEAGGVQKDARQAEALYRRAIATGDTDALYNLANLLCDGDEAGGVQKDARQAEALYRRAIAAGHTSALYNLANLLRYGDEVGGGQKDARQAEALYRRAIAAGHTGALFNLANLLRDGDEAGGVQKDARQAEALFRRAIAAGHTGALFNLANLLRDGDEAGGVQKDARQAEALYRRAIAAGHTSALKNLAVLLRDGDEAGGVQKVARQAEALYRRAIAAGHTSALYNLAVLLRDGDEAGGVQKDARQAEALYRRAIAAGHTGALFNLANLLRDGDEAGGVQKDARQAEALYRRAIAAGDTKALGNLANLLCDGDEAGGVQKDARQAEALYRRAIAAGHTGALFNLANLLCDGDEAGGVQKDARQAEALYRRAIAAGHTSALNNLAVLLRDGDEAGGVQKDARQAEALYRRAIAAGHTSALYNLAGLLRDGDEAGGVQKDARQAEALYRRAIAAGHTPALNNLARLLRDGDEAGGVQKDARQAEALYRRAIAAGHTSALYNLANLLRYGDEVGGGQKDARQAEALYRRAIAAGHTGALFNLANLLRDGDEAGGVQKDARQAEALYRRAIAAGHTSALNNLAVLLRDGDEAGGVQKDARQAEALYRRAIAAGHTSALYNLAGLLRDGDEAGGVQKDARQAEALYRRAIAAGHTPALNNLARLLRDGDEAGGVQKDARQAEALYRRAIAAGHTSALYNLAGLLRDGDEAGGVQKDARQAEALYRRAIAAGDTPALYNLANLLRHKIDIGEGGNWLDEVQALYDTAIERGQAQAHAFRGIMYKKGAAGLRIDHKAALDSFRSGWESGDALSGYLFARALLENNSSESLTEEAVSILEKVSSQQKGVSLPATHELAVLAEHGTGSRPRDIRRAAELYHSLHFNSGSDVVSYPETSKLIWKSGPKYPAIIQHVLQSGEATPKKCLLLTLGGGARGKSSTVRSIKRMPFVERHEKTLMAEFEEFVASPVDGNLDDGFIQDIDFNDSSLQASVNRPGMLNGASETEEIVRTKPRTLDDTIAVLEDNARQPHSDVILSIRSAMVVSEYGRGFRRAALTVWDMGGQHEYEMSHSLFVQRANVLVFVANLARVESDKTRWSEVQLLAYWIKFAHILTPEPSKVSAIVVATHKDSCNNGHERALRHLAAELYPALGSDVRKTWFGDYKRQKLPENIIAIENSTSESDRVGSGLQRLEDAIQKAADKIVEERPPMKIRWLALMKKLQDVNKPFYSRKALLDMCNGFPGFAPDDDEREQDIVDGLKALASMGRVVLFEVKEHERYVFLDVKRIVKAAGAVVSAVQPLDSNCDASTAAGQAQDLQGLVDDRSFEDLKKGIVAEDVLFSMWEDLGDEEQKAMRDLLINYDILMDLNGSDSEKKIYGVPALFQCGALDQKWRHDEGETDLYVKSSFSHAIPAGVIGRLLAFLHRKVSRNAPRPQLVRQNASLVNFESGQAYITFNRRTHELLWVFRSDRPADLARKCLKNLEDLFHSPERRLNVSRIHYATADCTRCGARNKVLKKLDGEWIRSEASPADSDIALPEDVAYCGNCQSRRKESNTTWFRDPSDSNNKPSGVHSNQFAMDTLDKFDVFISHAGEDKLSFAEPLHRALEWWGLNCFLDFKSLKCSEINAPHQMIQAMDDAKIGIFILSPEYATKRWPMKELGRFLERQGKEGSGKPKMVPVFFRITSDQCHNFYSTWNWFFGRHLFLLRSSTFLQKHKEEEGSFEKLRNDLSTVCTFTGEISHRPGESPGRRLPDAMIVQNVVDSVLKLALDRGLIRSND